MTGLAYDGREERFEALDELLAELKAKKEADGSSEEK
jgi:hypothetical protein